MRQVWDVAQILTEEQRNHTCWQEKPGEKKMLGRPKHRSRSKKIMACRIQTGFSYRDQ